MAFDQDLVARVRAVLVGVGASPRWAKTISAAASARGPSCAKDAQRAVRSVCSRQWKTCSARSTCCRLMFPADAEYGGIRSELEAAGRPLGGNDLPIAGHAYATGATTIVTANADELK